MDVGQIFSRSLRVYQRNLKIAAPYLLEYLLDLGAFFIFIFFALLALGASVLSMGGEDPRLAAYRFLTEGFSNPGLVGFFILSGLLLLVFFLVVKAAARAATIGIAYQAVGGEATFSHGMAAAKNHGLSVLGFLLTQSILVAGAILVPFIPAVIAAAGGAGPFLKTALVIFGVVAGSFGVLAVFFFTLFGPQEMVLKKKGIISGIRESAGFVYSHPMDVLVYGLIAFGLSVIVFLLLPNVFAPVIAFSENAFFNDSLEILQGLISVLGAILLNAYLETVKAAMVMED